MSRGLNSHCPAEEGTSGIGWIFGHLIDGTQAGVRYGRSSPATWWLSSAPARRLAVMMTAGLYPAARIIALGLDANRLEQARGCGATDSVNSGDEEWAGQVKALTDGLGVDVAIEAVGVPATFQACVDIIRPHRFIFDQLDEAYDTFSRAAETKALKVVLTR